MPRVSSALRALEQYFSLKHTFGPDLASLTLAERFVKPGSEHFHALERGIHLHGVKLLRPLAPAPELLPPCPSAPIGEDCPIWVYWAQGLENAPPIVKGCYESLLRHRGRHAVILLTQNNLGEYVHIPDVFMERLQQGCFGYTHFSDLLRCCLLYEQGGLYLDACMLLTRPIPPAFFDAPFYTLRHGQGRDWLIGEGLWIAGVLATPKGHPAPLFWRETLSAYWQRYERLAVYGLFDDALRLSYDVLPGFALQVNQVTPSCPGVFDLCDHLGEKCDPAFFEKKLRENYMLRLSYKLPRHMEPGNCYETLLKYLKP